MWKLEHFKAQMSSSDSHSADLLLVKNISFKSLKCKYLSDLIWNSNTGLKGRRRENSLIICNPLFSCLLQTIRHSFLFLSSSVTLLLKFYSHCLGVFFTFTFKEICLWVVDCWSLFISPSALRGTCSPIQFISPSACQSARRPASLDCEGRNGGREESRRGPRHATTHQGGTRQTWQPDDTCFCVSYHFTNHLHFIYVRLCTPTQSVKPVGLVRLRVKLAE